MVNGGTLSQAGNQADKASIGGALSGAVMGGIGYGAGQLINKGANTLKPITGDSVSSAGKGVSGNSGKTSGAARNFSFESLNRDQSRKIVENLLDNGEINLKDLKNMIPEGIPNTFTPTDTIKKGAKYEFQLSDGQKALIRWHEPDPIAASKFPDSTSGSRWTAQIKIGNKQVTIDKLWTKKQNLDEVHVPIQGR